MIIADSTFQDIEAGELGVVAREKIRQRMENGQVFMLRQGWDYSMILISTLNNIFIQVNNSINKTNLFRGGNHSSVVFAGSRDIGLNKLYKEIYGERTQKEYNLFALYIIVMARCH